MSGKEFFFTFFAGAFITILWLLIFGLIGTNRTALDNCAKTHNVYQCEMVAVPRTQENEQ